MRLNYPLSLRFKLIALAPRITVTDATGKEILYVHQKTFAFKEDVRIYTDSTKSRQIFGIRADRVIDWSAQYNFSDGSGQPIGAIKRKGMRSLWSATYNQMDVNGNITHMVKEGNPWIKVADALLGEIPIVGMFTGYLFHPYYLLLEADSERPIMQLTKQPAFFESVYEITPLEPDAISPEDEPRLLLGMLMLVQLERGRG